MKKLTDNDIEKMVAREFVPDYNATRRAVRAGLRLSERIPSEPEQISENSVLDLHQHTQEQAWSEIMNLAHAGIRHATIITGASGILHQLFPQWARESLLTPYIESFRPINNGSFAVVFKRIKK